jgi:hypothetical protein
MKFRYIAIPILLILLNTLAGFTRNDLDFLLNHNFSDLLDTYKEKVIGLLNDWDCTDKDVKSVLEYALRHDDPRLAKRCHYILAKRLGSLNHASACLQTYSQTAADSTITRIMHKEMRWMFPQPLDSLSLSFAIGDIDEGALLDEVSRRNQYNPYIEDLLKARMDEIAVERSDSLALSLIDRFLASYPDSRWAHVASYYRYYHLLQKSSYAALDSLLYRDYEHDPGSLYSRIVFLLQPKYLEASSLGVESGLDKAQSILSELEKQEIPSGISILYGTYTEMEWKTLLQLIHLKLGYYHLLAGNNLSLAAKHNHYVVDRSDPDWQNLNTLVSTIEVSSNDEGQRAELHFWKAKVLALSTSTDDLLEAAREYLNCLIAGAPRKRFDDDALAALTSIHQQIGSNVDFHAWSQTLLPYNGISFNDITKQAGLEGLHFTRVAIGDYDNDGWPDILFNGTRLFRNNGDLSFTDVTESAINTDLHGAGGLWADFNKDGRLDFASFSHAENGIGDVLMKNQANQYFVNVGERAGDIEDFSPTEGAAWIDIDGKGYPSIYSANYEKWQVQSGFPDFFWHNSGGYFSDESDSLGFRTPLDATDPGLAGRGVAPADYDNDGQQEILVTNYRLNRNFAFDMQPDGTFSDRGFVDGLAGDYDLGYFGHSIGADWGDYDNDGDLDVFIANLAHPRYIEFSDISMLLRNDGPAAYMFDEQPIPFHSFTNVTSEAGISYDELHSDPLWFDADNDGWLDLFITSVYENDRSYLYRNNGDGTFTDITWLSGTRVYNGWGNATGDLNRDGLPDLVVGSGNGVKILINNTSTINSSVMVKPVWKGDTIVLVTDPNEFPSYPNSPAFGTRVAITLNMQDGREFTLVRELCGAKGTTSQNDQVLHFGIGNGIVKTIERLMYEKD